MEAQLPISRARLLYIYIYKPSSLCLSLEKSALDPVNATAKSDSRTIIPMSMAMFMDGWELEYKRTSDYGGKIMKYAKEAASLQLGRAKL